MGVDEMPLLRLTAHPKRRNLPVVCLSKCRAVLHTASLLKLSQPLHTKQRPIFPAMVHAQVDVADAEHLGNGRCRVTFDGLAYEARGWG